MNIQPQNLKCPIKIFIAMCVIYGLYELYRHHKKYSKITPQKTNVYTYIQVPASEPYQYQTSEDEYQDFMRYRLNENIQYDIY